MDTKAANAKSAAKTLNDTAIQQINTGAAANSATPGKNWSRMGKKATAVAAKTQAMLAHNNIICARLR